MMYTTVKTTTQTASTKGQYQKNQDQADNNVAGVQTDQRIESRSEQIRADREMILVNELVPLNCGIDQKTDAQKSRDQPPEVKKASDPFMKIPFRNYNRRAAGKQKDGAKDR